MPAVQGLAVEFGGEEHLRARSVIEEIVGDEDGRLPVGTVRDEMGWQIAIDHRPNDLAKSDAAPAQSAVCPRRDAVESFDCSMRSNLARSNAVKVCNAAPSTDTVNSIGAFAGAQRSGLSEKRGNSLISRWPGGSPAARRGTSPRTFTVSPVSPVSSVSPLSPGLTVGSSDDRWRRANCGGWLRSAAGSGSSTA